MHTTKHFTRLYTVKWIFATAAAAVAEATFDLFCYNDVHKQSVHTNTLYRLTVLCSQLTHTKFSPHTISMKCKTHFSFSFAGISLAAEQSVSLQIFSFFPKW